MIEHPVNEISPSSETHPSLTMAFALDDITQSKYPVTETGVGLLWAAWRDRQEGDTLHVIPPDQAITHNEKGQLVVTAYEVTAMEEPYRYYPSQKASCGVDTYEGMQPCYTVNPTPTQLVLNELDVIMLRQERNPHMEQNVALLAEIARTPANPDGPVIANPPSAWALDSKTFAEGVLDKHYIPRSHHVGGEPNENKLGAIREFIAELGNPDTIVLKPTNRGNGEGITLAGQHPLNGERTDMLEETARLMERYPEGIVVQEYLPSIRGPQVEGADPSTYGEVRVIMVDGALPKGITHFAHRVPTEDSILSDSAVSQPTTLTAEERQLSGKLGQVFAEHGLSLAGFDIIRTPDGPKIGDVAAKCCGHTIVTSALPGNEIDGKQDPYHIASQVMDSVRQQATSPYPQTDITAPTAERSPERPALRERA